MNNGFRLMKIGGVEVKATWGLFLFGAFIAFMLGTGYFPDALPGWGAAAYLTAGLFAAVGLYASVLAHEMSHALVARRLGLKVEAIVLHLFGGSTNIKEEPAKPRHEFWLAVVGPITNLVLFGGLGGLAWALGGSNPAIGAILGYLSAINLLIGIINLLPASPLDGGSVLRSLVWGATKDKLKASQVVSVSGRVIGWGLVGLGFVALLNGAFDGLVLVLMGWFLTSAARVNYARTLTTQSLEGLTVEQVAGHSGLVLSPGQTLGQIAPLLMGVERGRSVPVVEQGYLLGLISPDVVRQARPEEWSSKRVEQTMTRRGSLLAFRPQDDLQTSLNTMMAKPAVVAAVIDPAGQFAGLIYLRDLPRYIETQRLLGQLRAASPLTRPENGLDKAA